MLIGLVGLKGSGKDTVAKTLKYEFGFKQDSFAAPLKDTVASVFGWDRELVEGSTEASRAWRETVDDYWSQVLGREVTPRSILQEMGTEVFRDNFNKDIWVASFKARNENTNKDIVVSDVRFGNEMEAIKDLGGILVRIKRGEDPEYIKDIIRTQTNTEDHHASETDWALYYELLDYQVENKGTLDKLQDEVRELMVQLGKNNSYQLELTEDGIKKS